MILRVDEWISGVTDDSGSTAKATLPVNPIGHEKVIPVVIVGKEIFILDDGSKRPFLSGITATTINVQAITTSAPYVIGLMDVSGTELFDLQDTAAS